MSKSLKLAHHKSARVKLSTLSKNEYANPMAPGRSMSKASYSKAITHRPPTTKTVKIDLSQFSMSPHNSAVFLQIRQQTPTFHMDLPVSLTSSRSLKLKHHRPLSNRGDTSPNHLSRITATTPNSLTSSHVIEKSLQKCQTLPKLIQRQDDEISLMDKLFGNSSYRKAIMEDLEDLLNGN